MRKLSSALKSFANSEGAVMESLVDIQAHLSRICENCGEDFGLHRAIGSNCPEREGRRTVGYFPSQYFEEWIENE